MEEKLQDGSCPDTNEFLACLFVELQFVLFDFLASFVTRLLFRDALQQPQLTMTIKAHNLYLSKIL